MLPKSYIMNLYCIGFKMPPYFVKLAHKQKSYGELKMKFCQNLRKFVYKDLGFTRFGAFKRHCTTSNVI